MPEGDVSERLKAECGRVKKLSALSESDKNGKYKKAIEELFVRLRDVGREYLCYAVADGFEIPNDKLSEFESAFYDGWLYSEEFKSERKAISAALLRGDCDAFIAGAEKFRETSRKMVKEYGGREFGG